MVVLSHRNVPTFEGEITTFLSMSLLVTLAFGHPLILQNPGNDLYQDLSVCVYFSPKMYSGL